MESRTSAAPAQINSLRGNVMSKVNPLSGEAANLELASLVGQQSSSCLLLDSLSERSMKEDVTK